MIIKSVLIILILGFVTTSPVQSRAKRFVNGQEYQSVADTPKYLVRINRNSATICSGSIVAANLVLTSGGCLFQADNLIPVNQIEIIAGDYDSSSTESSEQKRQAVQIYVHPDIRVTDYRGLWENDIAMIQVDTDFTLNNYVGKVDLWLSQFGVNASYSDFYTMVKASGFGGPGSPSSTQYDNLFDTYNPREGGKTLAQYQFLAYKGGLCSSSPDSSFSENDDSLVTYEDDTNTPTKVESGKRCFYTGAADIAAYSPTVGDFGGPVTWISKDNYKEYQVLLLPVQPVEKASFTHGRNYNLWGESLSQYAKFIGEAMNTASSAATTKYSKDLTSTTIGSWETFTSTFDQSYFGDHQLHLTMGTNQTGSVGYYRAKVTLSGTNVASTLQNSDVYILNTATDQVLHHKAGANAETTESTSVTAASNGVQGDRWGCTSKVASAGSIYTCEDADVSASAVQGSPAARASFAQTLSWSMSYNSSSIFGIAVYIRRPPGDTKQGSVTVTVEYLHETTAPTTPDPAVDMCDTSYRVCDDGLSCVPISKFCDGSVDCGDGRDETWWCNAGECLPSEFRCSTGECMRLGVLCDSKCDCSDKDVCEDETLLCSNDDKKSADVYEVFRINSNLS